MKDKVCFVSLGNLYLVPYIKKYISIIRCDYDIVFWNRHNIDEHCGENEQFRYDYHISENVSKFKKLVGYFGFSRFASNIIKKNKYSLIILLCTSAGMLLRSTLLKHYSGRFILDIRDYTLEKNKVFYAFEKSLVNNSKLNVISSAGYKKFLPPGKYITAHNELDIPYNTVEKFRKKNRNTDNGKIILTNIGLIRFHSQNKKIIDTFGNDTRFELRFIGEGASQLSGYCQEKNIKNVVIHNRFSPEETFDFLWETDCILNLYGNNTPLLDYALSNKLYYSAKLGLPILVCPNTYMEEISVTNGFGFAVDLGDHNSKEALWKYYHRINWNELYLKCDEFLNKVNEEQKIFETHVVDSL